MLIVLQSVMKAMRQLADRRVLAVLAKSLGVTLGIFIILGIALYFALEAILTNAGLFAGFSGTFLVSILITVFSMWILFRVVAVAVLQFFADEIVAAVEEGHYSVCGTALPFKQDVRNSARGIGRALLFNLLALPVAILLIFTAIGPGIVFLLVNAVLLGRELTDMCWLRLCAADEDAAASSPVSGSERALLGAIIAGLMLIPLANFLAPVIGAAAGTHLVHAKRASQMRDFRI
ncbi:MAG: EI24 domain-containing protein [Erythrobacter sp.]